MDSVFNSTTMATNTRDCGREISVTVKERTGATRRESCVVSIRATGMKIRSTAEALSFTRMGTDTTATGSPECPRVRAE